LHALSRNAATASTFIPARTNAGAGEISLLRMIGFSAITPPSVLNILYSTKEVMQYKKPNEVDLQLSNSAMEPINHRGLKSMAVSLQAQSIA
jgi:hypothetical protein